MHEIFHDCSDPLATEQPLSERGKQTYRAIAARLAALTPPIYIERHIAQSEQKGKTGFSTLDARNSTLDGINFKADAPKVLAAAFYHARDRFGDAALASMQEDPDHWALKASFGATVGTGWREVWRPEPALSPATIPETPGKADNMFRMRFGTAGTPIRFTALHCAVDEISGKCNVHIDESGFVLGLPDGLALTANFYGHFMNELLWKTTIRDWLSGHMPNETAARVVKEVIRRVSITFPNALNGYAGLSNRINSVRLPQVPADFLLTAGKILAPTGVTVDVYDNDKFKVQVNGTIANGDSSIAVTVGGSW